MDFHFTSDGKLTKDRRKGKRIPRQVNHTKKVMEEPAATTLPKGKMNIFGKQDQRRE